MVQILSHELCVRSPPPAHKEDVMENKPHEITVTNGEGEKLTITMHWDSDIWAWAKTFKAILFWLTFSSGLINDIIKDDEEE